MDGFDTSKGLLILAATNRPEEMCIRDRICVAVLTAWLNSGINFLYFSAGLSNIDETIYERASVDGASSFQKFYRLTLPGLAPMMFYTLVVNIIQAFQSFGQVKILTQGGPCLLYTSHGPCFRKAVQYP